MCHFLEVASKAGTYSERCVAAVTTHYAQMVWLRHCVAFVGKRLHLRITVANGMFMRPLCCATALAERVMEMHSGAL